MQITIDYGEVPAIIGGKVAVGKTPVVNTEWKEIECGFRAQIVTINVYNSSTKMLCYICELSEDGTSSTAHGVYVSGSNSGYNDIEDFSASILSTANGFKVKAQAFSTQHGVSWEYIAVTLE